MHYFVLINILLIISSQRSFAQITQQQAEQASLVIGKWLSKSTGHYDFLSASPVGPKRAGEKFFIREKPAMQTASDYGFSYMQAVLDDDVKEAYELLGYNVSEMAQTVDLTRLHLAWGFANKHDFTFSYLSSQEGITGWGVGYKRVLSQWGPFYTAYRIQYSRASLEDYFDSSFISNDLSLAVHFPLVDLFAGFKHTTAKIQFEATEVALRLPEVNYFADISELEYFYGLVLATTYNTRLTLQFSQVGLEYSAAAKFSFHYDSLLPTKTQWLKDPRYIRQ
jgi:hypothetical protein